MNFDCARLNAEEDREENEYGEKTALYLAVMKENLKIVNLLLTNPNIDLYIENTDGDTNNTIIDLAIENELFEITKLLKDYKSKHCKSKGLNNIYHWLGNMMSKYLTGHMFENYL